MAKTPIGLQLFTVRDLLQEDFVGTLEKVAELGYDGVEFAGYGDLTPTELKKVLDDLGLKAAGAHVPLEMLESDLDRVIEYHQTLESKFVSCPYVVEERRNDWPAIAQSLAKIAPRLKENGIQLLYHNHDFEFEKIDGQYVLDYLFSTLGSDLMQAELDIYWVTRAGEDPAAYIEKYSGRVPIVHLKDMADDENRSFAEVGEGIIDLEPIFAAAEANGVEWYIVEQDICQRPPLESAKLSLENLRRMGK